MAHLNHRRAGLFTRPIRCALPLTAAILLFGTSMGSAQINSTNLAGVGNAINPTASNVFLGAGQNNFLFGTNAGIVAGFQNAISNGARNGFIGAGQLNVLLGPVNFAFIGAGNANTVQSGANNSAIAAGVQNTVRAGAGRSVIVGGWSNSVGSNNRSTTIAGGEFNSVQNSTNNDPDFALMATIGGGQSNLVGSNGLAATIGGGRFNEASAPGATVPGGFTNRALGINSFAAGSYAVASNSGAFVWSDMSSTNSFISSRTNQFLIRATGGVGVNTNDPGTNALLVNGSARVATNLSIGGNLMVSGTITGTISNLTASSLTTTNNSPIELKPGNTTGFTVTPQGTANLALTNPDVVTTYIGTGHNIIGGFNSHFVDSGVIGATIAGGGRLVVSNAVDGAYTNLNQVLNHFGTVSGGTGNSADGLMATVSGGSGNWAGGNWSVIGGGLDNMIMDPTNIPPDALDIATIAGGFMNQILNAPGGTIGGGSANLITNTNVMTMETLVLPSTIAGGTRNVSTNASGGSIGGGFSNTVSGDFSTIPGGQENVAAGLGSFAAGMGARALHDGTFVWADDEFDSNGVVPFASTEFGQFLIRAENGVGINTNSPNGRALFVAGDLEVTGDIIGDLSISDATFSSLTVTGPILSGTANSLTGANAVIGGGANNSNPGESSTIAGGAGNSIVTTNVQTYAATISGGILNKAESLYSTVGGGVANSSLGTGSTVAGGEENRAELYAYHSTISGGFSNKIAPYADKSSIGGGALNLITDFTASATISGGEGNTVGGNYAYVGGGFDNGATGTASTVSGGEANVASGAHSAVPGGLNNEATGIGSFAAGVNARATNDYSFVWGGAPNSVTTSSANGDFTVRAPGGVALNTSASNPALGAFLSPGATSWSVVSDSNSKTRITAVDHREILRKVAMLPVTAWHYKHDPNRRYIGPMAQDFHAAFGLGSDDKHIGTLDTDGVTLSAIKGLVEEIREQDALLEKREIQIRRLEESVHQLRDRLNPAAEASSF